MTTTLDDLTQRRSLVWVKAIARARGLLVCEACPGQFYIIEKDNPQNRCPEVGTAPITSLAHYLEQIEGGRL